MLRKNLPELDSTMSRDPLDNAIALGNVPVNRTIKSHGNILNKIIYIFKNIIFIYIFIYIYCYIMLHSYINDVAIGSYI